MGAEVSWDLVDPLFRRYLLSTDRSQRTTTTYCYNSRFFWRAVEAKHLHPFTLCCDDVADWFVERRSAGVSPNKVYVDLRALRALYAFAIKQGWREDDPTAGIKARKAKLAPSAPFTAAEVRYLIDACSSERDKVIISLLAATGMRISEVIGMRAEDVDFRGGMILVHGKGGKNRWVAPNRKVMGRLQFFLGGQKSGRIWYSKYGTPLAVKSCRKNLAVAAKRVTIHGVHPHRFRTTFAIDMLRLSGGDLQAVQEMLGHESIETTQRYTAFDKSQRALAIMRRHDLEETKGEQPWNNAGTRGRILEYRAPTTNH